MRKPLGCHGNTIPASAGGAKINKWLIATAGGLSAAVTVPKSETKRGGR